MSPTLSHKDLNVILITMSVLVGCVFHLYEAFAGMFLHGTRVALLLTFYQSFGTITVVGMTFFGIKLFCFRRYAE